MPVAFLVLLASCRPVRDAPGAPVMPFWGRFPNSLSIAREGTIH